MRGEVVATLNFLGVDVRQEGMCINSLCPDEEKLPLLSLHGASLDPTFAEIQCMEEILNGLIKALGFSSRRTYTVCGINVFILKKLGKDLWIYRNLSSVSGPFWQTPGTLEEVACRILEQFRGRSSSLPPSWAGFTHNRH